MFQTSTLLLVLVVCVVILQQVDGFGVAIARRLVPRQATKLFGEVEVKNLDNGEVSLSVIYLYSGLLVVG